MTIRQTMFLPRDNLKVSGARFVLAVSAGLVYAMGGSENVHPRAPGLCS